MDALMLICCSHTLKAMKLSQTRLERLRELPFLALSELSSSTRAPARRGYGNTQRYG